MLVTLLGMTMLFKLVPANAEFPMLVTLLGIVTSVKPEQPSKTESSMLVIFVEIMTLVKLAPENAPVPIVLTPLGTTTLLRLVPEKAAPPIVVTLCGIVTLSKLVPENAESPMFATFLPSLTCLRCKQYKNALLSIVITPLPIVTLVRP